MGLGFLETFARSSTLMAGIGHSNRAAIQAGSLFVNKGAGK